MNRELIEAAKAVLALAYYGIPHNINTDHDAKRYAAFQRLCAAVRAAEAATNCGGDGYFTQRENTDAEKNAASQYADGLVSLSGDEGSFYGTRKNVHEAVRLAFLAGARSRDEAAPAADAERVREAVKAVCDEVYLPYHQPQDETRRRIADAIRPYIAPAPVADTVAVPVETLRELRLIATKPLTDQDCRNVCAAVRATVDALLPPPPAPEPSAELVKQWRMEATETANAVVDGSRCRPDLRGLVFSAAVDGYVAGRSTELVKSKKGGG